MPINPNGRVEDLIEEGGPLYVGVEVIQLLHSDHFPSVTEESTIVIINPENKIILVTCQRKSIHGL